jgi:flagellar assembly protein FliH
LATKIVKAQNVVAKKIPKVVTYPHYDEIQEEIESFIEEDLQQARVALELELQQYRVQVQAELAEWQKSEEERFRIQFEEEKKRGYNEGYEKGIEEGRHFGLGQYKEMLEKANGILEHAYQDKQAVIQEAEPFVIELSLEIAKKVLQQELTTNQEALIQMIKVSLSGVYESDSLSICVAPEDFAFVQKQREQLLAVVNGQVEVKVFPDYSIQHGGCIIRTSSGSVDARIDVQLSEIKKTLLAYQQEEPRE